MPISKYFKGKGEQVLKSMKEQYGPKKGEQVFYATANKEGMKPAEDEELKPVGVGNDASGYSVNGKHFDRFLDAVKHAEVERAEVIEEATGLRRWTPIPNRQRRGSLAAKRHEIKMPDGTFAPMTKENIRKAQGRDVQVKGPSDIKVGARLRYDGNKTGTVISKDSPIVFNVKNDATGLMHRVDAIEIDAVMKQGRDDDHCAEHSEFYPGCPMCQDGAGDPVESQIRFLIAKEQKQGKLEQAEQNLLNRLIKEGQKMRGVKDSRMYDSAHADWFNKSLEKGQWIGGYSMSPYSEVLRFAARTGKRFEELPGSVQTKIKEHFQKYIVPHYGPSSGSSPRGGLKDTAGHGLGDRRARLHRALDKVLNAKMGGPKRQAMDGEWVTVTWTPRFDGQYGDVFPSAKRGVPMRVESRKDSLKWQRKVGGASTCVIRPIGGTREDEVYRSEIAV